MFVLHAAKKNNSDSYNLRDHALAHCTTTAFHTHNHTNVKPHPCMGFKWGERETSLCLSPTPDVPGIRGQTWKFHEHRFLFSSRPSLRYESLVLWRGVLTTQVIWTVCQSLTGDVSVVSHGGWETSGHVMSRLRSQIWPHRPWKVPAIFFLTLLVSFGTKGLIKAMSTRNSNCIKPGQVSGLTESAWVCGSLSTPRQLLSTNRDITGYVWESITSIQE